MNEYRQSVTKEVIGFSGASGFSGTHSVLDWQTLKQGALGGRDTSLAYTELEEKQAPIPKVTWRDDTHIYIEPVGNRCYDTRVFASDDGFGAEEKAKEEEEVEEGKNEAVEVEHGVEEFMLKEEGLAEAKKEELSAAETSSGDVEILDEIESPVATKGKRGRPRSETRPAKKPFDKKKYTPEELKLPSKDWKAYIVLDDSAKRSESMVYMSPEGIPCYSIEMMYALEGIRKERIHVEKNASVLMRNIRALQLYPLFKSLRPDSMGYDVLLLQRIGRARQKKFTQDVL
jgi:hypothetical protein